MSHPMPLRTPARTFLRAPAGNARRPGPGPQPSGGRAGTPGRTAKLTAALATGMLAIGWATGKRSGGPRERRYYRSLDQAPYAPPAWAFAPAWAVAKTGVSWTTARIASAGPGAGRTRGALAALAVLDLAVYTTFTHVYFRRRSPRLAAAWTVADAVVTAAALPLVARTDRVAALGLVPQAGWLALATPVAVHQARHN